MPRSTFPLFPSDDGWPYPDETSAGGLELATDDEVDLDVLELQADRHAFDGLSPDEYEVLTRRFGIGRPAESMKQLSHEFGCSHAETRDLLGRALEKMRTRLREV